MSNSSTAVSNVTPETISVVIHDNRPVVTTMLLAKLYGTDSHNIIKNYRNNVSRFQEGKHYFKLEGMELKAFKNCITQSDSVEIAPKTRNLILWTERGAARHAKMLDTNQAWEVFERLEDCYFAKEGEWIPKGEIGGVYLDDHDLYKVWYVCRRFQNLNDIRKRTNLCRTLSALGSRIGTEMVDHFKDGGQAVADLMDRFGPQMDAAAQRLGVNQYCDQTGAAA